MKHFTICMIFFAFAQAMIAQNNVGINNTNPQFPLSFNGALGDKVSLWADGSPTHYGLGVQSGLFQIFSKTINDDVAFGFGSSTSFTERMRVKGNGNVGIGMGGPYSPLTFGNVTGQKISLYGSVSNNYGFGISGGLFQIHSDAVGADIAFGYGSSINFTERMRIKGNGNVGIGVANPQFPLEVNGRIRLSGTNPNDPGIWLNNAGVDRGFLGLQNNNHIGLYGTSIGWGFTMNTTTGALAVNGNEGNAGQMIQSNGTAAASWASPTNFIYNNMQQFSQTSSVTVNGYSDIPGMTQTITTPDCKVMIIIKGQMTNVSCFACTIHSCKYDILVDGTLISRNIINVGNGFEQVITNGADIYPLSSGSHTIEVKVDGNGKDFFIQGFKLVVVVIPQ